MGGCHPCGAAVESDEVAGGICGNRTWYPQIPGIPPAGAGDATRRGVPFNARFLGIECTVSRDATMARFSTGYARFGGNRTRQWLAGRFVP